jgi:hypothetical protein
LPAAAKYIAGGRDPATLSALELKRSGLLPSDWLVGTTQYALSDWSIGILADQRIAIALSGSPQGVRPLLDRYTDKAELLYPAPSKWNRDSSLSAEQLNPLLIIFDRTQIEAAARQLKLSPPPEMTTPFPGQDSHR